MRNDELQAAVFRFEKRVKAGNQSLKKGKANGIPMGRAEIEFHKDMTLALTALRDVLQRHPDPITGLVPCGCGGKAGFHYSVMLRDSDCYVECGICGGHTKVVLSEDKARDAWNTAMGWKGGAK